MSAIKYVKKEDSIIRGEGSSYRIANYITKENSEKVSLAVSELNGEAPKTMNTVSDRIYYFVEGTAEFIFENKIIKVEKEAALFIPANTEYKMIGSFKAILINSPAFSFLDEKHLEIL